MSVPAFIVIMTGDVRLRIEQADDFSIKKIFTAVHEVFGAAFHRADENIEIFIENVDKIIVVSGLFSTELCHHAVESEEL